MHYSFTSILVAAFALPLATAEYPPIIFTKPSWGIRKIHKEAFERHIKEINHTDEAVINDVERTNDVVVTVTELSNDIKEKG